MVDQPADGVIAIGLGAGAAHRAGGDNP
jgi:hypothetical protein